ncbi:hypothetical protein [Haematobacter missouriensis]|uniref:PEP-CTERM sorting domain-containing protein n=4 Tax=Haematobacter missouriensis TaxID=366616 RepID=A0ABX3ZS75_9RHOB|nr:hypothetical protein [Haematobacter missouriensis]OWJ74995.1 hypothetical protein CDV53_11865 [Haematobacter missouriensis]
MRAFALAAAACLGMAGQADAAIVTYTFHAGDSVEAYTVVDELNGLYPTYRIDHDISSGPSSDTKFIFYLDTALAPSGSFTASGWFNDVSNGVTAPAWQGRSYIHWTITFDDVWMPSEWYISDNWEYGYEDRRETDTVSMDQSDFSYLVGMDDPNYPDWPSYLGAPPVLPPGEIGFFRYTNYMIGGPSYFTVDGLPAPVPLPAAAPLILAGTAALWAVGRRRVGESCGSRA